MLVLFSYFCGIDIVLCWTKRRKGGKNKKKKMLTRVGFEPTPLSRAEATVFCNKRFLLTRPP